MSNEVYTQGKPNTNPTPSATPPTHYAAARAEYDRTIPLAVAAYAEWERNPRDPSAALNFEAVAETLARLAKRCAMELEIES